MTMREKRLRRKVLVAEDDAATARLIVYVLDEEGFEVRRVPDGVLALAAVERETPDALVLDVTMPNRDGISVLSSVRSRPRTRALPVVILSGRRDDESVWAGWRAGCDYYLTKPFDPEDLVRILDRLLCPQTRGSAAQSAVG